MLKPLTPEGRFECGLDDIVAGKVWCFVPVVGDKTPARLGIAIANERGYHPVPEHWCHADSYEEMAEHAEWLNKGEGLNIDQSLNIQASSMVRPLKPYTVIFYIDGEYSVETFVEHVRAASGSKAWDLALKQAKQHGGSSSGRSISRNQWECATEIATFDGHLEVSTD